MSEPAKPLVLHASAVAVQGRGLLIRGASGSGKSSLALELMSRGGQLIADDRVIVTPREEGGLWLSCPPTLRGMIEARGLGLLNATPAGETPLALVLDMDRSENQRLPPWRETILLNQSFPLLRHCETPYFAAAVLHYLKEGRRE